MLRTWLAGMDIAALTEGGATGADEIARLWALEFKVPNQTFFASWDTEGKAAGPLRNQRMLSYLLAIACDYNISILAMPGGAGTADMVHRGRMMDVPIFGPEHGNCYNAYEPYTQLTWRMLSLRALNNFYATKAAPLKAALKEAVEFTQNDETYGGRRVPPAMWTAAKKLLDPGQQIQVYEDQDVPF